MIAATTFGSFAFGQAALGHVDSQKVLDTMPSRKVAIDEMARFEKKAYEELEEMQKKLQDDYVRLQEEGKSMSKTAFKFEEDRIMRKSQEFQHRQEELEQQMQVLASELNAPILDRLQKAVEAVSKREKLDYVLDVTSLLYSNGKDITDKVVQEALKLEAEAAKAEEE